MARLKWTPTCDGLYEDDPPNYYAEINSEKYGKYVWLVPIDDEGTHEVQILNRITNETQVLKECKSLTSAKRWVATYMV